MSIITTRWTIAFIGCLVACGKSDDRNPLQKEMDAWADAVCACKDEDCGRTEYLKGQGYVEKLGNGDADDSARRAALKKATKCTEKLK